MKHFCSAVCLLFITQHPSRPPQVPDAGAAIKIAEAAWLPVYGKQIYDDQPFEATLERDSIWHVRGTLPDSKFEVNPEGDTTLTIYRGGVPEAWIMARTGEVLSITHGK